LCHQFKLLDTAQEIIDLDGVVNWLSNLNQVPDNYSIKALIKIIVKLGSLKPRKVRSYDVQVIMENALHDKIFANTDILDVHQDLPKLVAKRYFSREDPELMREVELDEVFPLNTEIAPANRDPESGSYRFEFVHSDTSEHVFRTVENMMRLAFQSGVNMQSVCIPLIKGPSGCGKTRMGAEAVTHGVNYLLRMNPPKNSERVFVEMLNRPELDSSLYCDTDTSGVSRINSIGYLVAILAFALRRQSDHPSNTLLIRLMKGYNNFSFDNFNVRLRQILKVPVLFLHLDEYRDDLVGTNALINLCAETLRYGPSDDVVRIFPIITGMTSYIDGDAVSDAFRRTSRRTSRLPHVMLFHLKGLGEFPACVENLESQFLQYLVQDVEGRPARANELAWVRQREGNRDWPNLRPFLNDIDGYPRFYEFALRSISDSDKKDLLLTYAESDKILAIHQRLLRSMGYFFLKTHGRPK